MNNIIRVRVTYYDVTECDTHSNVYYIGEKGRFGSFVKKYKLFCEGYTYPHSREEMILFMLKNGYEPQSYPMLDSEVKGIEKAFITDFASRGLLVTDVFISNSHAHYEHHLKYLDDVKSFSEEDDKAYLEIIKGIKNCSILHYIHLWRVEESDLLSDAGIRYMYYNEYTEEFKLIY